MVFPGLGNESSVLLRVQTTNQSVIPPNILVWGELLSLLCFLTGEWMLHSEGLSRKGIYSIDAQHTPLVLPYHYLAHPLLRPRGKAQLK